MISFKEFNFKKSVKLGNLEKSDKVHFDKLTKSGWDIKSFNVTSKGYEIEIWNKKLKVKGSYTGKNPSAAIKVAANSVKG